MPSGTLTYLIVDMTVNSYDNLIVIPLLTILTLNMQIFPLTPLILKSQMMRQEKQNGPYLAARTIRYAILISGSCWLSAESIESQQHRYDRDYPEIGYSSKIPTDKVNELNQLLRTDREILVFESQNGYLRSLLEKLQIPVNSQALVFSRTSINARLITARTPRAIYFSDDTYVGWVQGSESLEIAATDPDLGIVFYTLGQKKTENPEIKRQNFLCLECHDTYGLTGGGVPRLLMGSGTTDEYGRPASHEGWTLTDHRTPLAQRWGGWYVTGSHDNQEHLGNLIVTASGSTNLEKGNIDKVESLTGLIADDLHLVETSDIVALLLLEHQIHIQNLLIRLQWEASNNSNSEILDEKILLASEKLLEGMFLVDEAQIMGPLKGNPEFQREFENKGPYDRDLRSLRQLDLNTRLFRYPFSYMVYSESFEALPRNIKHHLFDRIWEVLRGRDRSKSFEHLSSLDRGAILEILRNTKTDFRNWQKARVK